MSTRMNAAGWELAMEAFRDCPPAPIAKAKNDRLFLEAPHHVTVHNINWRSMAVAIERLLVPNNTPRPG